MGAVIPCHLLQDKSRLEKTSYICEGPVSRSETGAPSPWWGGDTRARQNPPSGGPGGGKGGKVLLGRGVQGETNHPVRGLIGRETAGRSHDLGLTAGRGRCRLKGCFAYID